MKKKINLTKKPNVLDWNIEQWVTVIVNKQGIILIDYLEKENTTNSKYYIALEGRNCKNMTPYGKEKIICSVVCE